MAEVVRTGGCVCGAVRYEIDAARMFKPYACHCRDCHSRSGSAFTIQIMTPPDGLTVTGELIQGRNANPAGIEVQQFACARCLTRIYSRNPELPGLVTLRAGTLDDSEGLVPAVHLWTSRKQPWIELPEGAPTYPEQPADPLEWVRPLVPEALRT